MVLTFITMLPAVAQESLTHTMFVNVKETGGCSLVDQYGSLSYFIRLELPDISKAPINYHQALIAVRDTILSQTIGMKYIKGDKDYKAITRQFEIRSLNELNDFIGLIDPSERENRQHLFRWYFEYSGGLDEDSLYNPVMSDIPFFQFFLQKLEQIGNTFYTATNLIFDSKTGQLLTIEDLFEITNENYEAISARMMKEFRKLHPEETDYDYEVTPSASFEITEKGLNFYIPTVELIGHKLEYIFLDKSILQPYLKPNGSLAKYWK